MSIYKYDSTQDELIPLAGQGKAEYGASTVRTGTFTGTDNGTGLINITVTFDNPMPDADYLVDITDVSSLENFWVSVAAKTKNGFALYLRKSTGGSSITVNGTYTAFKLYTDTEYNNLLNNAVLKSDVTDSVTNGNMNPVTSNAVYDTLMNITTLTPTKTANVGTIYEAEFLRIGRLVFVNLNLIINNSGILFTGLPKPTSRQTFTINGFYETNKALRLIINTNGSIETDNDLAITNQNVGGHIVYITTEN